MKRFILTEYANSKEVCCDRIIPGLDHCLCPVHSRVFQTSVCDRKLTETGTTVPQIEVVNLSKVELSVLDDPGAVYIGRKMRSWRSRYLPDSPLANPFKIDREGTRGEICDKYCQEVLWPALEAKDAAIWSEIKLLADRVRRGESLKLCCWCYPDRCHGDDVRAVILEVAGL